MDSNLKKNIYNVCKQIPDCAVCFIYGSAAKNRLTAKSDVDIAIACESPLSTERKINLANKFSEALKREIDIVDLQQVSGVILKEALGGEKIMVQSPLVYASLLKKLWYNQADMMPNIQLILKTRREKFLNEK